MRWTWVWIASAVVVGAGILIRLVGRRSSHRQHNIWSTCLAASPVFTTVAALTFGGQEQVNTFFGVPNVAPLIVWLTNLAANGCCLVFCHALRTPEPVRRIMAARAASAVIVSAVLASLWSVADIHTQSYSSMLEISDPFYVAAEVIFWLYFGAVCADCAWTVHKVLRTPIPNLGTKAALIIGGAAAYSALLASVLFVVSLPAQAEHAGFAVGGLLGAEVLIVAAMVLFTGSAAAAVGASRLDGPLRSLRIIVALTPLWHRIRELYPDIALPSSRLYNRPGPRAQRMLIEIGDALRLIEVPTATTEEPVHAVAEALKHPQQHQPHQPHVFAVAVLPAPSSREDEEELFFDLARAYRKTGKRQKNRVSDATSTAQSRELT